MLMVGGRPLGYHFFGGYHIPLKASIMLRVRPYKVMSEINSLMRENQKFNETLGI